MAAERLMHSALPLCLDHVAILQPRCAYTLNGKAQSQAVTPFGNLNFHVLCHRIVDLNASGCQLATCQPVQADTLLCCLYGQ